MLNEETKRTIALGICTLFFGVTMLGFLIGSQGATLVLGVEEEADFTHGSGPTLNVRGSEASSVFSHSVLNVADDGPIVVLANGTTIEWSAGSAVYSEDSVISSSGAGQCSILSNYSMYCTGSNNYGQLGLGNTAFSAGYVSLSPEPVVVDEGKDHSCAILVDASLWCWGRNHHGQIGDDSTTNRVSPVQIDLGTNVDVVAVSAGEDHTCAITDTGDVKCWGYNIRGQLGDGTTNDSYVPIEANHSTGLRAVSLVTAGRSTCAIFDNGSVGCWGNKYTVFSDNGAATANVHLVDLGAGATATMLDGVGSHTCAVIDDGSMQCWGVNTHGQLGDGTCSSTINSACSAENIFPGEGDSTVQVNLSAGLSVLAAATSTDSTCALLSDDSLRCWGAQSGEFDNTSDSMLNPYELSFTDGAHVAFTDQDMDGDGTRNIFDTHQTGDDDGDGVIDTADDYPNNPARWTDCDDGKYGRLICTDADAGHSAPGNTLVQTQCEAGTFQPYTGQSTCLDASAGHYSDSDGATSQSACASGYYNAMVGQSSCTAAPAGSFASTTGGDAGATNTTALPLSVMSANYSATVNGGSDTSDVFSLDLPRNAWFSANLTSPVGQDFNIDLLNETFDMVSFSATNATQEEVSTSAAGNASGLYYIRIMYSSGSTGPGNYSLVIDLRSTSGSMSQIGSTATLVDAEHGISTTLCGVGTWQNQVGSTSCNAASAGHYVYGTGATTQTACSPGYYQPTTGQTTCIIASTGYYVPTSGAASQTAASPGYYVNVTGSSFQQACAAGTYQTSAAQTTCFAANPGYYVPTAGQANMTICDVGTYQPNSGQTSCIDADPGNYVPNQGATAQSQCLVGTYQPYSGQWACLNAEPGHYVPTVASTSQIACVPGTYQPASGQDKCDSASAGYYVNSTAAVSQDPCLPGTYQPSIGQTECLTADAGHYVDTQAATAQIACSAGSYNPNTGADEASDCMLADTGHYVALDGSVAQNSCSAGTFAANMGQIACDAAAPGYYVPTVAADAQIPCALGSWQASQGATECATADPGHYVDQEASTMQTACAAGSYNPSSGSIDSDDCMAADAGSYVDNEGSAEQLLCPAGTYQPAPGQSSCIDADFGYHVPTDGSTGQIGCSMGSYQGERAGTECLTAEPGHYVDSHFASAQQACLAGTYNPNSGSTSANDCIEANSGYFVAHTGSSAQEACELGTYQPSAGWSNCLVADPGFYVDTMAATAQIACEAGNYNPNSGSVTASACSDADPGNYVPDPASSAQIPCEEGNYQNLRGQTECKSADLGYYVDSPSAISQNPAPIDYYIDTEGATEALPCPNGQMTMVEAAKDVSDCHIDTDGDRIPDFLDRDDDGDGIEDGWDLCDYGLMNWTSTKLNDWDQDGCEDTIEDNDDDNDGYLDDNDVLPLDPEEWLDTDGDGIGNNADTDDDGDGIPDLEEQSLGLDPLVADYDGDGYNDSIDAFPKDADEWIDTDGDGVGDNSDKFPTIKFYQNYVQASIHLVIGLIILGVIGFSVRMGMGRNEKPEAEDSTHELREIGGVEVRISAEDMMYDDELIPEPEPEPEFTPPVAMFDLDSAQPSVAEVEEDEPKTEPMAWDLTHEAESEEESLEEDYDESADEVSEVGELDLGALLDTAPPPKPRVEAPEDAQINEHGQKVWQDANDDIWVQNPDGSLLKHNVLTGAWEPYEQ